MFGKPRNSVEEKICDLEKKIFSMREEIQTLRSDLPQEAIEDYLLLDLENNQVKLSELFGDHDEMILIHNMGPGCPYCTLWADGYRSMKPYFESRCAFVLETDKPVAELEKFRKDRGWDFKTVSSVESSLKRDMGFKDEKMNYPGVSTLFKTDSGIFRHATAPFGPGDNFSPIWHFFDLLKNGHNKWQPSYN